MPKPISKKLLYSLTIVLLWLGFVVDGSHALFTSAAQLTGNTLSSGTAELQVSNSQGTGSDSFATSQTGFSYTLTPGGSQSNYFFLKNNSESDIGMDISVAAGIGKDVANLANSLTLTFVPVDSAGLESGIPVSATLANLSKQPNPLNITVAHGASQRFKVTAGLDTNVIQQDQDLNYDLTFNGVQHSS